MSSPGRSRVGGVTVDVWAGYSLAERERRWDAARAGAAKAGLDCLWVPLGNCIDGRYLTQLRCASIVLPTDGSEPIILADRGSRNEWAPEPRFIGREWAEPMAQALLDAGMDGRRVGVVGLRGGMYSHVRSPDGVVVHTAFEHVRQRVPRASFEDATDVLGRVRYVKGDEELASLRRAAAIAEAGVEELIGQARSGGDAAVLYARVMARMLRLGTEYYPLALYLGDGRRLTHPPAGRRLEPGMLITSEVSAVSGAEVAQEDQPVLIGRLPDSWRPAIELQREAFDLGLRLMRPGATFGALVDGIEGLSRDGLHASVLLHGRGYGDDGPLISPRVLAEHVCNLQFEAGNAFIWKPTVTSSEGFSFTWGGDVIITPTGAERLSKRPQGLVEIS